ncbi:MAG: 3-oxoacyl-[acyl-carrier-protein] synthase III C-terminal domain-containing protein [Bacteroidota bacterium]
MRPRAYLSAHPIEFGTLVAQRDGVDWMKAALRRIAAERPVPDLDRALRLYDLLARRSSIDSRVTALEDYTHQEWDRMQVHAAPAGGDGQALTEAPPWYRAPLDARMEVFARTARSIAEQAFGADTEAPDALIQVSCTGYDSPTAAQRMADQKGWADTRLLHIGHMGCYAALPASAMAADLVTATAARQLAAQAEADLELATDAHAAILLMEMCTLHHDPATTDVEQIVQQCLFADGAVRVDVTAQLHPGAFALIDHIETILPGTMGEMTWRAASPAFRMTLSRDVPDHIHQRVEGLVESLLARNGLAVSDVDVFAVHPGGPRVIERTAEALGLEDATVRHSQEVLRTRGNMSSTTLPHIWAAIAKDEAVVDGDLVCSIAFGPGLTATANLMRKEG